MPRLRWLSATDVSPCSQVATCGAPVEADEPDYAAAVEGDERAAG